MAKFIKLHECQANDGQKIVLVNVACIEYFCMGNKGKDTYVKLIGPPAGDIKGAFFFVKESLEEIERLISLDTTKAPVIMTAEEALKYHQKRAYVNNMSKLINDEKLKD